MSREVCGICWCPYDEDTGACACAPQSPPQRAGESVQEPVAWRYWKDKFACWEYSDTRLEFPAVPAGTKMYPLYSAPPQRTPLTDEQKQAIHNETGAGHSLICLVESYINGIKE